MAAEIDDDRIDQIMVFADPEYRRKIQRWTVIAFCVAVPLFWGLTQYWDMVGRSVAEDPAKTQILVSNLLWVFTTLFVSTGIGFGIYLWRLGRKIFASDQFPPPGVKVIKDTVIVSGSKAVIRGRIAQLMAAVFICLSAGMPIMLWRLFELVFPEG